MHKLDNMLKDGQKASIKQHIDQHTHKLNRKKKSKLKVKSNNS